MFAVLSAGICVRAKDSACVTDRLPIAVGIQPGHLRRRQVLNVQRIQCRCRQCIKLGRQQRLRQCRCEPGELRRSERPSLARGPALQLGRA